MFGNFFAVQINDRILIHALKQKCQCLIQVLPRQRERLFIGIFPARKIAAVLAVLAVFLPGFLQHGIMGQGHRFAGCGIAQMAARPAGAKWGWFHSGIPFLRFQKASDAAQPPRPLSLYMALSLRMKELMRSASILMATTTQIRMIAPILLTSPNIAKPKK